jgi:hypothetical protein
MLGGNMSAPATTALQRLMLYDPEFKKESGFFMREDPANNGSAPIGSLAELENAMNTYEGVQYLAVNTHGGPGRIQLADKTKVGAASFALCGARNPHFLAAGSRIIFEGCNIGEGSEGDLFLDDIGKSLFLGKGGIAGAATSTTVDDLGITRVPMWGKVKVYRYDASGKRTGAVVRGFWDAP